MAIINGNENANTLTGGSAADTLNGLGGNDTLLGNGGNDTLDGGTGNDLLIGGLGSDTYRFGQGYGFDVIDNSGGANNDVDTIRLTNLNANQIRLTRIGSDLVLSVLTTGETLTVSQHFLDAGHAMDRIQFVDGSRWDSNAILANLYYPAVTPTEGADLINGNPDDDVLQGLGGNDSLFGNGGNDLLDGGPGADRMEGGIGNDTYVVDNLGDLVVEAANSGDDTVQASIDYTLGNNVERLTLLGAAHLNGTGNALANILVGNSGNNQLDGGDGADVLQGGAGNDTLLGGAGNDSLTGGDGNDMLDGGAGNDSMAGGTGDDLYLVAQAGDSVSEAAGEGNDTVRAAIAYTLGANLENLELTGTTNLAGTGNALDNRLTGNSGGNTLNGGAGNDWLAGRQGNDTYLYGLGYGNDVIDNSGGLAADLDSLRLTDLNPSQVRLTRVGDDLVLSVLASGETLTVSQHFLDADHAIDRIQFADGTTWTSSNILSNLYYPPATPTEGADVLNGNPGDDVLQGLGGNDTLFGNGGNDLLDGGTGADRLEGGIGNDTYVVDNLGDAVVEAANSGDDTVQASINYTLGNNVERLTLLGTAHLNGTGNTLANTLIGNSGNNQLDGGDGADILQGGAGNDTMLGGAGNDSLSGGDGNDLLDGGAGNDSMAGGAGDDLYLVAQAGDSISEAAGAGSDTVRTAIAYTLGANLENLELIGTANLAGTGNELDNRLTGNSGRNTLNGGAGNDWLAGREGNDTYVYGLNTGNDEVDNSGGLAGDVDTLQLAGLNPADVRFQRSGNDMVMLVNSTSATLTVKNFYLGSDYEIDRVQFANGTLWNRATLLANVQPGATNGADLLIGSNGDDLIQALGGNDEIRALGGNDTLDGGTGDDAMFGGAGDDLYVVDSTGDQISELANEGNDSVRASVNYTLGSNVENLTLTGTANLDGTGNAGNNQVLGNAGNNTLRGEAGNDVLQGGGGVDFLWGGDGNDTLVVGNSQTGTLLLGEAGDDTLDARNLSNVGGYVGLSGGSGNDTYLIDGSGDVTIGDDNGLGQFNVVQFSAGINPGDLHFVRPLDSYNPSGNLVIEFANGHRLFIGSMGLPYPQDSGEGSGVQAFHFADGTVWDRAEIMHRAGWYFGTTQNDSFVGSAGADYLNGSAGDDQLNGLAGNDYVNGSTGNDAVAGGDGDDLLDGSDGDDIVSGGAGDDQLYGNYGNDTLAGDSGNDVYHYFLGYGRDTVDNRSAGQADFDAIVLENPILPSQVSVSRINDDLVLTLNASDRITVLDYFLGGVAQVDEIRFANGTAWAPATVLAMFSAPPSSTDDSATTDEDTPLVLQASDFGNYSDPQNTPMAAVKITSLPALGSLQYNNGSAWVAVVQDQVISMADLDAGKLQFVPALNGNGNGYASIGFKVSDGTDFAVNASTLSIDVAAVNDAPILQVPLANQLSGLGRAFSLTLPVNTFADIDAGDTLVLSARLVNGDPLPVWLSFDATSRSFTGTPPAGTEPGEIDITVTATDAGGLSVSDDFTLSLLSALVGTPNDDVLNGSVVDDAIYGLAGNDQLFGFGGNDLLDGGSGFDTLSGGQGNDTLLAGNDNDGSVLLGEGGDDTLIGSGGSDTLYGDTGNDSISGGNGNDRLQGDMGSDQLQGGDGNDFLEDFDQSGQASNNNLDGGAGDDTILVYQSHANAVTTIAGGSGRDTYILQANSIGHLLASDFAAGANGDILNINQLLLLSGGYSGGNPFDPVLGYLRLVQQGADTLLQWDRDGAAGVTNDWQTVITLQNTQINSLTLDNFSPASPPDGSSSGLTLSGTPNDDVLNGSVVDDAIYGLAGNDQLFGFGGNDLLDGGSGFDTLSGGQGNDTLLAGNDNDGSVLLGEGGDDTLIGSGGSDTLYGDTGNDSISGGNGNDFLEDFDQSGQAGNNNLDGGAGDDTILVYQSHANAVTTIAGGSGRDTYILQANSIGHLLASDFAAGANGDILNINQLLLLSGGYSGGNPFDPVLGYLRLVQQGADTLLQWDRDGAAGATNDWQTVITLQNTQANSLIPENFAPATGIVTIEVVNLNAPPVVGTPLSDQSASEDAVFNFTLAANAFIDPNVGDSLTYGARLADGNPLPAWLSFDPASRTFSGTPGNADVGTLSIRVTATDTGNLSVSDDFTLSIANTNDAPTVSVPVILTNGVEDQSYTFTAAQLLANASDVDVSDTLSVQSVSVALADGSVTANGDGTWTYSPAANRNGAVNFTVVISDGSVSINTTASLDLAAVNDAPTMQVPIANQLGGLGRAFTYTLPANTFIDVDAGDSLTLSATLAGGASLPAWLNFDAASRTFSGTSPEGTVAGSLDIVVTATDAGGLSAIAGFSLDLLGAIIGTPNADILNGSVVADAIYGLADNDQLYGFGGDDLLDGGSGYDQLYGGQGNDVLLAGDDSNGSFLDGEAGDDSLTGSNGSDYMLGRAGNDLLAGGDGNDNLFGDEGSDVLIGGDGNDYLEDRGGELATNTLDAGAGDDTIVVAQGNINTVTTVTGGSGRDTYLLYPYTSGQLLVSDFASGAGGDILSINVLLTNSSGYSGGNPFDPALGYLRLVQQGADTLLQWDQNGTAAGGDGWRTVINLQNTVASSLTIDNFAPAAPPDGSTVGLTLIGTPNADTLNGSAVADAIYGLADNDQLYGFGGDDLLDGGSGYDQLYGGQGNDVLLAGDDSNGSFLDGEAGDDSLTGSNGSDYMLGRAGNDLLAGGDGNDNLFGDEGSDVLIGGDGNDYLEDRGGEAATNTLDAGAGDDTIVVAQGNINTVTTVTGGSGRDTYLLYPYTSGQLLVSDFASGAGGDILSINVLLTNSSGYSGGNPFDPALGYLRLVQQGADTLLQWDQNGTAAGGDGWRTVINLQNTVASSLTIDNFAPAAPPDGSTVGLTLIGTPNADTLNGSVVADAIYGLADNDQLYGFGGDDLLDGGSGYDQLYGGQGNDVLLAGDDSNGSFLDGEAGDDSLTGSNGSDYMLGRAGNDLLAGGDGNDNLFGDEGSDVLIGGDGNDYLEDRGGELATNTLDAGAGDDTIVVAQGNINTVTTVTGGSGRDTYLLYPYTSGQLLVSDFASGAGGDILNINVLLTNSSGYSGGNPFDPALGYLRLVQQGADTLLQWDQDGAAVDATSWMSIITLRNTTASTLTLDNFAPATSITNIEVVNLNAPPTLSISLSDQAANEDAALSFTIPANAFVDPNPGDTLSYSARLANGSALPTWLSFDTATRTFIGTPSNAEVGSLDIRVTATDTSNASVSDVFTLTIANTNDAPTVSSPVTLANGTEDQSYTLTSAQLLPNASDVDVGATLSVQSVSVAPADGSVADNGNGTWTFSPAANRNGTVTFTVVITDGTATVSTAATLNLAQVNDAPTGNVTLSGTAQQGQTLTASHNLTDADGLGAVSYQWQSSSDGTTWQNLAGATTASLALGSALVGLQVRVLASYTDGGNTLESVASSATAGVTQAPNTAPVLSTPLADQTANEDAAFTFTVPANAFADPNPGDTLSYSARLANGSALPTWLSFDTATHTFTGTPGNAEVGSLDIRVTATDTSNASVSDVFTLTIANTNDAPTVSSPVTLANGTEDQSYPLTSAQLLANASDVDVGATLNVQSVSVAPADGNVADNGNGTWTFSPAANRNGTVTFTVVITDGTATVSTAATLNLAPVNDAPTGNVTLSGIALEGQTLTASHTLADADGLGVVSYQWQTSTDGAAWQNLAGATAASLVLGTVLIGLQVRVVASYTDGGNTLESVASSSTAGIAQLLNPIDGTDGSDNPLLGTDGADLIRARMGNDVVQARAGDDTVFGEEGDDVLFGEDGNDSLDGGSGYNQLLGGNGNDTLILGTGATDSSYASGGSGDDLLIANGLANTFAVTVIGDSGSDTYRFDGSGNVALSDYVNTSTASDVNRLELAAGITPASVTVSGDGNSITLGFATGGTLLLANQLLANQASDNPNQYGVQEVRFSNGTVWSRQDLRELAGYFIGADAVDDTISTGAGNQFLYGHGGNDSLTAGAGDDQLYGALGDDVLNGGDGNDVLFGEDGNDSLDGGSGYNQLLGGNGNDTLILGTGATDSSYASGGSGDDLLIANGLANTFAVTVIGDSGSDTYRYDGSGNVTLSDYVNTSTASDVNRLELAAGITPASVTVSGDGNSITLGFATGGTLLLANQLLANQASDNPNQYGVQEVRFSNGTVWSRQDLRELAGYFIGADAVDDTISTGAGNQFLYGHGGNDSLTAGAGDDQLYGGLGDDLLNGGDGNDVLFGEDGNDSLDGGSGYNQLLGGNGNDTLILGTGATDSSYASGGSGDDLLIANGLANTFAVTVIGDSGSDTYRFDGSGNVTLSDYVNTSTASDVNRLELGDAFSPASVTVFGDVSNITLSFTSSRTVLLSNQIMANQASDNPNQYGVQEVRFSDGTVWSRQDLRELAGFYIGGDATDDSFSTGAGTQVLYGHGGNDSLSAGAGDDLLNGGLGDDLLEGGEGNDFLSGDDGNDTLDGGSGFNQLIGGNGDDIFRFSAAPDAASSNIVIGFANGADILSLSSGVFQFNGEPVERVLANVNGLTEQMGAHLVFNQSDQTLYYDADGATNGNSVAVVTLAGVASLAASDVQLFT